MKVILLNGSPKSKGCTYTALKIIENELINEGIETYTMNTRFNQNDLPLNRV